MKTQIKSMLLAIIILASGQLFAQSKKEIKDFESTYAADIHKKFVNNPDWAMCKLSIIYKLSTANLDKAVVENKELNSKVKTSSGAYAMLNGVSEEDLQAITDKVAQSFIKRMKDEAGVNVTTWSEIKKAKNINKLLGEAEDREIYSKSQGLAYAMSYEETPHYNKVIVLIPGGKKLSKEIDKQVMELQLIIDFAEVTSESNAYIQVTDRSPSTISYAYGKSADQKIYTGVRLLTNIGSQNTWEAATDNTRTGIKGHDLYGYYFFVGPANNIISDVAFAKKIEPNEGNIPEVLDNRKNNKIEYVNTFDVFTTPEKYGEAVLDVANQYFDLIIKYYNWNKG
jgi:hypothetical protein